MSSVIDILKQVGAIITDSHIVYTSSRHGSVYINKDALYPHTKETSEVGNMFAEKYKDHNVDVVVGPALGGIILSQWTAHHLSELTGREVLGVYTEKTPDLPAGRQENGQQFTRGYGDLVKSKRVLVLEDITNTGGSVVKVVDAVRAAGGEVIAVCVMVNRDPENVTTASIGAPFESLAVFPAESFDAAECPLCQTNVPINTSVGHGKKYLESVK